MGTAVVLAVCPVESGVVGVRVQQHGVVAPQSLPHKKYLLNVRE